MKILMSQYQSQAKETEIIEGQVEQGQSDVQCQVTVLCFFRRDNDRIFFGVNNFFNVFGVVAVQQMNITGSPIYSMICQFNKCNVNKLVIMSVENIFSCIFSASGVSLF